MKLLFLGRTHFQERKSHLLKESRQEIYFIEEGGYGTLGMKGAKHNDVIYPSPSPKQTMDVSGAGDTFTASFILKYKETNNISESIVFANLMASIVVSKRGVTTP